MWWTEKQGGSFLLSGSCEVKIRKIRGAKMVYKRKKDGLLDRGTARNRET